MHGSKLFEVLGAFDPKELRRLHAFLISPFFAQSRSNELVVRLLEWLLPHAPDFRSPLLTKATTFANLFPEKDYHPGQLEKVMTSLLKETYRFLPFHQESQEQSKISLLLAQAHFFQQRGMEKYFNKTINQLHRHQEQRRPRDIDFYYDQYQIDAVISEFASMYNTRNSELHIPETLRSFDNYYLLHRLEYTCKLLSQNQHFVSPNIQDNIDQLEEMLPRMTRNAIAEIPLIRAYINAFDLLRGKEDEKAYTDLCEVIETHEADIPRFHLQSLETFCRNYCIYKYNSGEAKYLPEAFRLYRLHFEKGHLYYEGRIMPSTIQSLVSLGLRLREYDWIYQFLEATRDKIAGDKHPEEVFQFNLASYYFALNQYEEALELLTDKYEDIYYKIVAKRLEIKIYYEQDSPLTSSRLDAFKIFIFRLPKKSISNLQREGNNRFADILKQILNPKTTGNEARINKLIQKVGEHKVLADKGWLLGILKKMTS
ncbi:MAG: hypothetical protein AAFW73_03005 [Bacteroidota bacterium]